MKNMIAIAAGIGLVTASPASSETGAGWTQYATWADCMEAAELSRADSFTNHSYTCSPSASGGYELVWTKVQRTRDTQKRARGKRVR